MKRYCGSKWPHLPHDWQAIGRPNGPHYECPGKGPLRYALPNVNEKEEA